MRFFSLIFFSALLSGAIVPLDLSGVKTGPVTAVRDGDTLAVRWDDDTQRRWVAIFRLDNTLPLIASIGVNGKTVLQDANPLYNATTGKRRGGFDEFFDFPPSHPDGTRSAIGKLKATAARAETLGNRVEVSFEGFEMGIFKGSIRYTFYPGGRLIQQAAVAATTEADTAYFYDAGLAMAVPRDVRPGNNMDSQIAFYNVDGKWTIEHPNTSERLPVKVKYRAIAARAQGGTVVAFPAPHKYFMPRDFTTNMGFSWHTAFRGKVSLGIRQLPDDNSNYYPWMNAPPNTQQRMNIFYLLDDGDAQPLVDRAASYSHRDHFEHLDGFVTVAPHWHFAYTVQAMAQQPSWVPPFKPVLKDMGVDAAIIADFHGDGHPQGLNEFRLKELKAYYDYCRAQSKDGFLLAPSEEANVHYGGHWAVSFPKPVYWFMAPAGTPSKREEVPGYGTVYTVGDSKALLDMVRREKGFVYTTHPRTKGSKLYPDKYRYNDYFLDDSFVGVGWKQMPADMASPRLGERSLTLLDDMSNWGIRKLTFGEVDVFQVDSTHELYAHMNINYVRAKSLPSYDNYGQLLDTMRKGDFFVSTGEVLLPEWSITEPRPNRLLAKARFTSTLPMQFAEVVWGDGKQTHRQIVSLDTSREFTSSFVQVEFDAPGWRWARIAAWDIAGDGAFANPIYNEKKTLVVAVDAWHNKEALPHYAWEGTYAGGFSGLGDMFASMGAATTTIREPITATNLAGVDCLIIVDPDIPKEAPSPNYITPAESDAILAWVRAGGKLVLLGNDPGNAEFEHFNELAKRFGIEFEERKHLDENGNGKLTLPRHGLKFYAVDLAPLKLTAAKYEVLLKERDTPMMAIIEEGKGKVLALGDPWVYNEYLYAQDNRQLAEEVFRKLLGL